MEVNLLHGRALPRQGHTCGGCMGDDGARLRAEDAANTVANVVTMIERSGFVL